MQYSAKFLDRHGMRQAACVSVAPAKKERHHVPSLTERMIDEVQDEYVEAQVEKYQRHLLELKKQIKKKGVRRA